MFTKEERIFALKTWYKGGYSLVVDEWNNHFNTVPPSRKAVYNLRQRFNTNGSVADCRRTGRPHLSENTKLKVLQAIIQSPNKSIRRVSLEQDVSNTSAWRVLHKANFKSYVPRLIQDLSQDDPNRRIQFCELMLNEFRDGDQRLFHKIVWSDEATFKLSGHVNRHNCTYWYTENRRIVLEKQLNQPGVTVWGGISCRGVVGPWFFDGTVNGDNYLEMLRNYAVPELQMTNENFHDIYFQHDGAPPHYAIRVREYVERVFGGKTIGRGMAIEMPPRSPDLTPMDFFFWGFVKEKVYRTKPRTIDDLKEAIQNSFQEIDNDKLLCEKVCLNVPCRMRRCINKDGKQFEKDYK